MPVQAGADRAAVVAEFDAVGAGTAIRGRFIGVARGRLEFLGLVGVLGQELVPDGVKPSLLLLSRLGGEL
jgi:hypothetical protein